VLLTFSCILLLTLFICVFCLSFALLQPSSGPPLLMSDSSTPAAAATASRKRPLEVSEESSLPHRPSPHVPTELARHRTRLQLLRRPPAPRCSSPLDRHPSLDCIDMRWRASSHSAAWLISACW
jgi:hypothetical protein